MPVKQTIPYNYGIYSITFTCYNWLQLIDIVNGYDIVYRWFDHLKQQGHYIPILAQEYKLIKKAMLVQVCGVGFKGGVLGLKLNANVASMLCCILAPVR